MSLFLSSSCTASGSSEILDSDWFVVLFVVRSIGMRFDSLETCVLVDVIVAHRSVRCVAVNRFAQMHLTQYSNSCCDSASNSLRQSHLVVMKILVL